MRPLQAEGVGVQDVFTSDSAAWEADMLANHQVNAMVPTKDLDRARGFYEGTLGFKPDVETEGGVSYRCADQTLFVVYQTQVKIPGEATVANWMVDDLDAEIDDLKSRGVQLLDVDLPGVSTKDRIAEAEGIRAAWFNDPDGNILGLTQLSI